MKKTPKRPDESVAKDIKQPARKPSSSEDMITIVCDAVVGRLCCEMTGFGRFKGTDGKPFSCANALEEPTSIHFSRPTLKTSI